MHVVGAKRSRIAAFYPNRSAVQPTSWSRRNGFALDGGPWSNLPDRIGIAEDQRQLSLSPSLDRQQSSQQSAGSSSRQKSLIGMRGGLWRMGRVRWWYYFYDSTFTGYNSCGNQPLPLTMTTGKKYDDWTMYKILASSSLIPLRHYIWNK